MSTKACLYTYPDRSDRCNRPREDSDYCILHDPNPGKNPEFVRLMVKIILDDGKGVADFTGSHFFETKDMFHTTQRRPGVFDYAVFHQDVDFSVTIFRGGWSMKGTRFEGDVRFSGLTETGQGNNMCFDGAVFEKRVDFTRTTFTNQPTFRNTEFRGGANFSNATFHGIPVFEGTKFLGDSTFQSVKAIHMADRFDACDLSCLRILSLPDFPKGYQFADCTWDIGWWRGRPRIFDERVAGKSLSVLNAYRELHRYYYSKQSDFNLSRGFYVSFMIMQRKVLKGLWNKSGRWFYDAKPGRWFTDIVYWGMARYGESIPRPFIALLMLWFGMPLLIQAMIDPPCVDPGYWTIFWDNLMASTMYRSLSVIDVPSLWPKRFVFLETFLNVLFIGFLALAVRRSFVPKKPMESQGEEGAS